MIVELMMFFGIGFLLAALSVLVVAPLVHGRAVRLTARRLEASIPLSMAEVQADKDLQRAEFAISTRRLEVNVEQLRTKSASQLAELGRKSDAINRLKAEVGTLRQQLRATEETVAVKTSATREAQRQLSEKEMELATLMGDLDERSSIADAQKIEIMALKNRLEELKERLAIGSNKIKVEGTVDPLVRLDAWQRPSRSDQHHEGDTIHLAPEVWLTAKPEKVPMESSQCPPPHGQRDQGDIVPIVPKDGLKAEPIDSSRSPPLNDRHRKGDIIHLVPRVWVWPTAEAGRVPSHSSPSLIPNGQRDKGLPFVPKDGLTAGIDCSQRPSTNDWHHEGDIIHLASKVSPTAGAGRVPSDSSKNPIPNGQHDEGLAFVLKDGLRAEPIDSSQSPSPSSRHREGVSFVEGWRGARPSDPDRERNTSEQCIGTDRKGSDFSDRVRAVESSIREFPRSSGFKNDPFVSNRSSFGRRTYRTVARFSVAAMIGVGGLSVWYSHSDEAIEKIGTRVLSLGSWSSVSTQQSSSALAPATAATSPKLVRQLEAMPRDLAVVQRGVEQLAEKQKQMARHIATLQAAERHFKKTTSFAHLRHREKLTPWPETRPTTIAGWTLRKFEIGNGTVVLEGPNGVWRAMRGDTVPGVGRVESIVRWGSRLIVATSSGLISTP